MSVWTAFTYQNSWSDWGSPYATGAFKIDGDRVWLRGVLAKPSSPTYPSLFTTLPSGLAVPGGDELLVPVAFNMSTGFGINQAVVKVDSSGNLYIEQIYGFATGFSLSGLSFSILS